MYMPYTNMAFKEYDYNKDSNVILRNREVAIINNDGIRYTVIGNGKTTIRNISLISPTSGNLGTVDLNNIVTPGTYGVYCKKNISHAPNNDTGNAALVVIPTADVSTFLQIISLDGSTAIYMRWSSGMNDSIVWDEWIIISPETETTPTENSIKLITSGGVYNALKQKSDIGHEHTEVNGHTVESDVPANAIFTDTVYDDTEVRELIDEKQDKEIIYKGYTTIDDVIDDVSLLMTLFSNPSSGVISTGENGILTHDLEVTDDAKGIVFKNTTVGSKTYGKLYDILTDLQSVVRYNSTIDGVDPDDTSLEPGLYSVTHKTAFKETTESDISGTLVVLNTIGNRIIQLYFEEHTASDGKVKIYTRCSAAGSWTDWEEVAAYDTTPTKDSDKLITSGGVYTALSEKQDAITGGSSTITSSNLTASRALVSNSSGKVAVSDVTSTELGYLDGVTSNVQTQLNGKTPYAVKSSVDFNTMTTPGLYTMRSSSTNAPTTGSYHSLIVNKSDNGNYIQQIAIKESTMDMYMRYCNDSTWSGWVKVAKINDIPTSLKNPNPLTLTMNGTANTYNGEVAYHEIWYAPTTAGTVGYELVSSGSGAPVWKAPAYAVCSTAAATAEKTVSVSNFKLVTGAKIAVKFNNANTVTSPTLNVNSTGAKLIQNKGINIPEKYLSANKVYEFIYDGTYWQLIGDNEIGDGIYNAMGGFYNSTVNSTNYPNIKSFLLAPMTYNNLTIDCASSCEFIGTGEIPIHYFPYKGENYSTKTRFDNPSIKASQSVTFRNILFTGNSFISEQSATYDVRYQFIDCDFCINDGLSGTPLFSLKNSSIEFVNCRFYLNVNRPGPCFHIIDSTNNNNGTTTIKLSNSIVNYSSVGDNDPVFATTNGNSTRVVIEDSYMGNMSPIKPTAEFHRLHGIFIKNTTFDSCNRIGSVTTYSSLTEGYFIVNGCCFTGTDAATIYASGHTVNISNNTFVVRSNIYLHGDYNVFSNNVNCYPINLYEYGNGIITGNTASSFSQSVSSSTYAKTGNYPTIS